MKVLKKLSQVIFIILILITKNSLYAQETFSWEFPDTEIKDVLFAISLDSGISIIPDNTVSGKIDFRFSGKDFSEAFDSFLESSKLYVYKTEKKWTVSRILVSENENTFSLDCSEARPVAVIEKYSKFFGINVTYEQLPSTEITVHLKGEKKEELLENLVRFFSGYCLEKNDLGFHIKKTTKNENISARNFSFKILSDNRMEFNLKEIYFSQVLESLFSYSGFYFCFVGNTDVKASRSSFIASSFDEALNILCSQNGFSYRVSDKIYYIFPSEENKGDLINGKRDWCLFPLKYGRVENVLPILQKRFHNLEFVVSGRDSEPGIWTKVTENEKFEVERFIKECDLQKKTYLIPLKYIKAEEFMKRLPPSVDKNSVSEADGNCCIYFSGSEESYKKILEEVELCDRPQTRLKYDLLILQYDDTSDNQWAVNYQARNLLSGDSNTINARLGNVLGLNLNVISAFGLDFALSLQNSISENRTRVFANTSLYGLAGKEINFTNTNTYRYRDNNLDPETGKPIYSGITREIVSGLKLEIKPWVGEDGMITSFVKASVSRRGVDSSSVTGNPPPTSEKIVTTEVCGRSGEPVVLSGLVSNSESEESSRTPFLSKIPLLGKLFKSDKKNNEKTQMVIYLVPLIENEEKQCEEEKYTENWFEKRKEELCRILNSN